MTARGMTALERDLLQIREMIADLIGGHEPEDQPIIYAALKRMLDDVARGYEQ